MMRHRLTVNVPGDLPEDVYRANPLQALKQLHSPVPEAEASDSGTRKTTPLLKFLFAGIVVFGILSVLFICLVNFVDNDSRPFELCALVFTLLWGLFSLIYFMLKFNRAAARLRDFRRSLSTMKQNVLRAKQERVAQAAAMAGLRRSANTQGALAGAIDKLETPKGTLSLDVRQDVESKLANIEDQEIIAKKWMKTQKWDLADQLLKLAEENKTKLVVERTGAAAMVSQPDYAEKMAEMAEAKLAREGMARGG